MNDSMEKLLDVLDWWSHIAKRVYPPTPDKEEEFVLFDRLNTKIRELKTYVAKSKGVQEP